MILNTCEYDIDIYRYNNHKKLKLSDLFIRNFFKIKIHPFFQKINILPNTFDSNVSSCNKTL